MFLSYDQKAVFNSNTHTYTSIGPKYTPTGFYSRDYKWKKIFLFISFFIVLTLTLFIANAYKKGAKNTVNFVYGMPPAELQSYIEKAKKGDSEAASSLVYTFSRRDLYSSQLFSDWTWYAMTLKKNRLVFQTIQNVFLYIF